MKIDPTKRRRVAVVVIAALALVATAGVAVTGDASALNARRSDDTSVRSWPYETGALAGTSETYVDMWEDGSYYDPSLGRRVSPR
jgi:hypothetical protein